MPEPGLVPLSHVVATALAEDLGVAGRPRDDRTAAATIPPGATATAAFIPRTGGIVAGCAVVAEVYRQLDPDVEVAMKVTDGDAVTAGQRIAVVSGPAAAVLAGERTALNLLTHLSGIASSTRRFVDAVAATGCIVRDTRKTLPGLRALQKAAVVAGGGHNHRMSLLDGLLVKDNHVAAAGGVTEATKAALDAAAGLPVQIEVDSLEQVRDALVAGAPSLLLDNFSPAELRAAVQHVRSTTAGVFLEASGGITLQTAAEVAATGVDAIAVGALTHSAEALDIGLDVLLDA